MTEFIDILSNVMECMLIFIVGAAGCLIGMFMIALIIAIIVAPCIWAGSILGLWGREVKE